MPMKHRSSRSAGFTLVEMVMVLIILGVIGSMVAVFMKHPVDAYFAAGRRAALTDVADTAVRRMARDVRRALPNSVSNPSPQCIEFIPTKTGGRYRAVDIAAGDDTSLNFTAADTTFNMLGVNGDLPADQRIVAGDLIAVYNLGIPGSDAYSGSNTAVVSSIVSGTETIVNIASQTFLLASPENRFQVIPGGEMVVAYVCDGGRNLRRTTRSFAAPACPASGPILATNVDSCNFAYVPLSSSQRDARVQFSIALRDIAADETVTLYHEVHVDNTP